MLNVTVTCDHHRLSGQDCSEEFHCDGAEPQAPAFGPYLRSGWVQFMDGWTYRFDEKDRGWLTLCPKHSEVK